MYEETSHCCCIDISFIWLERCIGKISRSRLVPSYYRCSPRGSSFPALIYEKTNTSERGECGLSETSWVEKQAWWYINIEDRYDLVSWVVSTPEVDLEISPLDFKHLWRPTVGRLKTYTASLIKINMATLERGH